MAAERPKLILHPVECDGCGVCVDACRPGAIKPGPNYIYVDWTLCDGCGTCADLCDRDAIETRDAAADVHAPPLDAGAPAAAAVAARPGRAAQASAPTRRGRPSGGLEMGAGADIGSRRARLWRPWAGSPGSGGPGQQPPERRGGVPWSIAEAIVVVVIAVGLQVVLQALLGSSLVRSLTENGIILARGTILALYYAIQIVVLLLLALRRDVGFAEAFRLDSWPDLWSIPIGLSLLAATWLFSMTYHLAAKSIGWSPPASEGPVLTQLFGKDAVGMTLTVIVVVLLAPLVEELLLRGVVLTALLDRLGRWWAIAISALMFATLHGMPWSFLPMTFLGVALGYLASRRRSLWPAIALHASYNGVIVGLALLAAA